MSPFEKPTSARWGICLLLFLATTVNYVDRQILALLKPLLDEQFAWTNTQYGLVNAAFQGAYALSLLGFGWFVDRFGARLGYAASIVWWSLGAASHALAGSIGGFLGARLALGLGEGGNFPSAVKVVAQWFPRRERALATALFNSGANAGAIAAPALVPLLVALGGWRAPFLVAAVAGLAWTAVWIPLYRPPETSPRANDAERRLIRESDAGTEPAEGGVPWKALLACPQAWSFIVAKFLTDPVWYFFLTWLPDFFKKTRGLDLKHSWPHLVTTYSIVTVLSIAGGWLTGHLAQRGWSVTRARRTGLLAFALCVVPILAVVRAGDWAAVALIGLAGAAHQAWSSTLYTTVSDLFPKRAVASLVGIGSTAGAISGAIAPLCAGRLLDADVAHPAAGYAVLFGYCAMAYLVAFAANAALAPRLEPVRSAAFAS